jgi:8-oxo-dGTP pyrophosphatase MutT (NUDIX family)
VIERIIRAVAERASLEEGTDGSPARAAVALIFHRDDAGELRLLFIRRAQREGDPWSGQIALPGGRWSASDPSLEATALRETLEETGIDLERSGYVVGRLDELRPRTALLPPIIVTPVVTVLRGLPELALSDEVAEAFWVPWSTLMDPGTTQESSIPVRGATWRVPSFVIDGHVVWGMTERILRSLLARLGDEHRPVRPVDVPEVR